uniref:Secreted protein n=1 Tax=Steinernema glaseri TaxID=37863 RepID=A0A1I7YQF4_9BILA
MSFRMFVIAQLTSISGIWFAPNYDSAVSYLSETVYSMHNRTCPAALATSCSMSCPALDCAKQIAELAN